ncbi:hypothetical protein TNCV_2280671 [Trichonephila clavipes]|nr:hypothetical protein TNCV_2280671 [Trichonephila clavipes]
MFTYLSLVNFSPSRSEVKTDIPFTLTNGMKENRPGAALIGTSSSLHPYHSTPCASTGLGSRVDAIPRDGVGLGSE